MHVERGMIPLDGILQLVAGLDLESRSYFLGDCRLPLASHRGMQYVPYLYEVPYLEIMHYPAVTDKRADSLSTSNNRAGAPCDRHLAIAFESNQTNSSAPKQFALVCNRTVSKIATSFEHGESGLHRRPIRRSAADLSSGLNNNPAVGQLVDLNPLSRRNAKTLV